MSYSTKHSLPPKDIGIDLLRYKEKEHHEYPLQAPNTIHTPSSRPIPGKTDSGRYFHVALQGSRIHVVCYTPEGTTEITGLSGEEIAGEMAEKGLLPEPQHAIYLGGELARAEIALKTGRSYIQDNVLFEGDENRDYRS
jgi:dihydropteroate synthase